MTLRLHVDEHGNPAGPSVLLFHGFLSSNVQWDLNVERLGAALRLLMVEMPGHGRSPAPDDVSAYGPEQVIPAIDEVRRRCVADRVWLIGHSLGGATAVRYALTHPEGVRGLVFTNTRAAFGAAAPDGMKPAVAAEITSIRDVWVHPVNAKRFPDDVKQRMVAVADRVPLHAVSHVVANRHNWSSAEDLGQLDVPTLLVNGRWERAFQPCVAQARTHVDRLEVVDLEGGHSINVEQPEAFDDAVLDFVRRCGGTEGA